MNVPFRIGGTSFICQDRWFPPVEQPADRVEDIEIPLCERECGVFAEAERCPFHQNLGRC